MNRDVGYFVMPLATERIDDRWVRLTTDLRYRSTQHGWIVAPKGFATDYATVFRFPLVYWLFGGRAKYAAVVHDWLYSPACTLNLTRKQADAVFLEAMRATNQPALTRWLMWLGVRLFGRWFWKRPYSNGGGV